MALAVSGRTVDRSAPLMSGKGDGDDSVRCRVGREEAPHGIGSIWAAVGSAVCARATARRRGGVTGC